jgi:gas vesicle protein
MSAMSRVLKAVIDVIATVIENTPPRISEERLVQLLGPKPIVSELFKPIQQPEAKSHIATPPGTSQEHYCYDCMSKHLGTAKILLREALQRATKGEPREAVLEKVRGAYEELMGAEDDSQSLTDERTRQINSMIRDTRKWFYDSGVIVEVDKNKIAEALQRVSNLSDEVYKEIEARKERLLQFIQKTKERLEKLEQSIKTRQ